MEASEKKSQTFQARETISSKHPPNSNQEYETIATQDRAPICKQTQGEWSGMTTQDDPLFDNRPREFQPAVAAQTSHKATTSMEQSTTRDGLKSAEKQTNTPYRKK